MKYVRIKSYHNGKFVAEQAYIGDNHAAALKRFRTDYPSHNQCILVAETVDDKDPKWTEWFRVARNCGCVNCF